MARVGFELRPCWSRARRFNHSTTLPTLDHTADNLLENHLHVQTKQCSDYSTALPLQIGIILQQICFDFKSTCL